MYSSGTECRCRDNLWLSEEAFNCTRKGEHYWGVGGSEAVYSVHVRNSGKQRRGASAE